MKEPARWEPEYSVNVQEIDLQHKQLFRMVGELEGALRAGHAEDVLGSTLDRIVAHAVEHFATEEALMEACGYPGLVTHSFEHSMLSQQLTQLNLSRMVGRPGIPAALLDFLHTWLREHILKSDKQFGEFLVARGVTSAEPR